MVGIVDCNNFYASCERVFNPQLENKPVVVLSNNDGCVIARSNEAKALGIPMGVPAFKLEEYLKGNQVYVYSSNYALYGDMSERVMTTISGFVKDIEIYSIDECFLDFAGYEYLNLPKVARELKQRVKQWTGIPISIGIAPTKTLAKVANKTAKKSESLNGVLVLNTQDQIKDALKVFPVDDIWGIGRQYAKFLKNHRINTAYELVQAHDSWIKSNLTIVGLRTVEELRGMPCNDLELVAPSKKTICTARSFGKLTSSYDTVSEALANYASVCATKLRKQKSAASIISVFLETNSFRVNDPQYYKTKSMEMGVATNYTPKIIECAQLLLKSIWKQGYNYKKCGIVISGLVPEEAVQQSLFDTGDTEDNRKIMHVLDALNSKYGRDTLKVAAQGHKREWKLRQEKLSMKYTTDWNELLKINI